MRRSTLLFFGGLLCLSAFLLLAPGPAQSDPGSASQSLFSANPTLQRAQWAMKQGREKLALRYAREVVRSNSRSRDRRGAYSILCVLYRAKGDLKESLRACDGALRLMRKDDWRILASRANTLLLLGRADESLEDFQSAVALLEEQSEGPWKSAQADRDALAKSLALIHEQIQHAQKLVSSETPPDPDSVKVESRAYGSGSLRPAGDFSEPEAPENP